MIYDVLNDAEEKAPLTSALANFLDLSEDGRYEIYRLCYQLALIDDDTMKPENLDSAEKFFLQKLENTIDRTKLNQLQRGAEKELSSMKAALVSEQKHELFQMDLNKIRKIAASDYENARAIIGELRSQCRLLERLLSSENEISNPQLKQALQEFREIYREQVSEKLERLAKNISQKELSCRSFSLALMGRTKAGKSTLHAIMCGEGDEFIGTGKQRTTRFNRIFSWNSLKIIDTPGIGAGESDGQTDTEIACRVISQADVICFVVADDTITQEILDTLDMIAAYHKPMIVLLNHKDDINKKSHLKKFASDPEAWKNCTNEDRLSGWIDRLNRNAEKNGYLEIMTVVPVFLLAAKKGMQEDNSTFYQASNYPGFIEQIRQSVNQNCILYKSQTMLDEPSVQLHQALITLKEEEKTIRMFLDKVRNISSLTLVRLNALQRDAKQNALRSMKSEFDDFFTEFSAEYTEENYTVKSTFKLQENYEAILHNSDVISKIQDQTEGFLKEYRIKIDQLIHDLEEEIRYANINISLTTTGEKSLFQKTRYNSVPVRGILKVASMILDVAAIWYPALAVISVPLSFISGLFKTKSQKQKTAKKQTRENFRKLVEWQKGETEKQINESIDRILKDDKAAVTLFLDSLIEQTDSILHYISQCREAFEVNLKKMDTCYAVRILQFITEDAAQYPFSADDDVIPYRNPETRIFEIRTRYGEVFNVDRIRKITGEKIRIKKYH